MEFRALHALGVVCQTKGYPEMFDFFRSRDKAARYILIVLLSLVALSLVVTLVPGWGGGWTASQGQNILAEVGDDSVTALQVQQVLAREARSRGIPAGMEEVMVPMLVDQMVNDRALAYEASRRGMRMSDAELAETIRSLIPQLYENGKFVGRQTYEMILAQQNMTIPEFEANVRKQALASRLESIALEGVIVTPEEVETAFRKQNEKYKISYFTLSPESVKNQVTVTPAELQEAWKNVKMNYKTPERRSALIFPLDEARIAATVQIPEAQLRQAYQSQPDRYRLAERVKVRHILLKTTGKSDADVAKTKAKADDLLKQIKSGADFAQLAQKNSEDTTSAVKGGDVGYIVKGQTVPEFENSAFSMKNGQVSDLVKTQYGFHILRVEGHEPARVRPFEEVKADLTKEVARSQVFEKMQSLADQIRNALVRSTEEAEKLAAANGITPVRADKFAQGDPIPEVGANQQFVAVVGSLPVNGVTPAVPIGSNKLVVAKVTAIDAPRQAELADVESQIRNLLQTQKAVKALDAKTKQVEALAKQPNADLAAIAKQAGAEVKNPPEFTRMGAVEGLGAAAVIEPVFDQAPGVVVGPIASQLGPLFVKITERIPADLTQLAAQREQLLLKLKGDRARQRRDLFTDGIVKALVKEKKIKLYDENIKRLAAGYRNS
jgi:peptidyl-prolyl cis-trans isomerase D